MLEIVVEPDLAARAGVLPVPKPMLSSHGETCIVEGKNGPQYLGFRFPNELWVPVVELDASVPALPPMCFQESS
jgi:hypothetical protein